MFRHLLSFFSSGSEPHQANIEYAECALDEIPSGKHDGFIEKLKSQKDPWTEIIITIISRIMSNEQIYVDSLDFVDSNNNSFSKEIFDKQRHIRNLSSQQILENKIKIQQILRSNSPDHIKKRIISDLENLNNELIKNSYINEVGKTDLEHCRAAFHYATGTSNRDDKGKRAINLIDRFRNLIKEIQLTDELSTQSEGLIDCYAQINLIAGQRERILSYWDNPILTSDYEKYKTNFLIAKQNNYILSVFENGIKVFSRGPLSDEKREIAIQAYLNIRKEGFEKIYAVLIELIMKISEEKEKGELFELLTLAHVHYQTESDFVYEHLKLDNNSQDASLQSNNNNCNFRN